MCIQFVDYCESSKFKKFPNESFHKKFGYLCETIVYSEILLYTLHVLTERVRPFI